jgi:hypothetical protein
MKQPMDTTPPLATAFPPWHSSALIGVLLALSIVSLPQDLDDLAKVETFTRRIFPTLVSLPALVVVRLGIALSCWLVTLYMLFLSSGWEIGTTYKPTSKLRNTTYHIGGFKTLVPFTSWCWIMLGSNFSLTGYIALMAHLGREQEVEQWVLRSALVLWELSAPFALLVSAVVRYAIWPVVLATGKPHKLGSFRNQMQHNMNSFYVLSEMAILGGPPIKFAHISLPFFVGAVYILFTWFNCYFLADPTFGPQYMYWFMDPTLGKNTTIALVALMSALVMSFCTFFVIDWIVKWTEQSIVARLGCVFVITKAVSKTKD